MLLLKVMLLLSHVIVKSHCGFGLMFQPTVVYSNTLTRMTTVAQDRAACTGSSDSSGFEEMQFGCHSPSSSTSGQLTNIYFSLKKYNNLFQQRNYFKKSYCNIPNLSKSLTYLNYEANIYCKYYI